MAHRRSRRALSAVVGHRGATHARGDPELAGELRAALEAGSDAETRTLTHGFHSYPARMHPGTARLLVGRTRSDATILDPFAGSGTVLVEAVALGHRAIGVDANPLAVRLARLRTSRWSAGALRELVTLAGSIAGRAARRAVETRGVRLPGFDPRTFAPHVFRELFFLRQEVWGARDPDVREALSLVLSAILVKVSMRAADTSEGSVPKRIATGFSCRHFAHKAEELARGLDDLRRATPPGTPPAEVLLGDARQPPLPRELVAQRIVSSPPYPGVYDYGAHHALRFAFLGIDARRFEEIEIGSRRGSQAGGARARWHEDLRHVVASAERHLGPAGLAIFLVGDGIAEGKSVPGDESLAQACAGSGLVVRAVAWQERPSRSPRERAAHGPTKRELLVAIGQRAVIGRK